uniref:Uncharacterized protein n=1 Tax=Arundo donax TaxID=35708 RepID=A0A0A9FRN6_ARUDO
MLFSCKNLAKRSGTSIRSMPSIVFTTMVGCCIICLTLASLIVVGASSALFYICPV